jgi:hypothetical protein
MGYGALGSKEAHTIGAMASLYRSPVVYSFFALKLKNTRGGKVTPVLGQITKTDQIPQTITQASDAMQYTL